MRLRLAPLGVLMGSLLCVRDGIRACPRRAFLKEARCADGVEYSPARPLQREPPVASTLELLHGGEQVEDAFSAITVYRVGGDWSMFPPIDCRPSLSLLPTERYRERWIPSVPPGSSPRRRRSWANGHAATFTLIPAQCT